MRHTLLVVGARSHRIDAEALAFHEAVRATYLALAAAELQRWVIVDAGEAPEKLAALILSTALSRMGAGEE